MKFAEAGTKKTYLGHRSRLFERVLDHGLDSLLDYEVLECLLSVIPRKDVKPLAKELLLKFGSIAGVLDAEKDDLLAAGLTMRTVAQIKFCRQLVTRYLAERTMTAPIFRGQKEMIDYMRGKLGGLTRETLHVLFLDNRNKMKAYAEFPGTIDRAPVFPRELVEQAIRSHAVKVLLAHNHPSGDCHPSPEDCDLSRRVREMLALFGIELLDHLIVTRTDFYSILH